MWVESKVELIFLEKRDKDDIQQYDPLSCSMRAVDLCCRYGHRECHIAVL